MTFKSLPWATVTLVLLLVLAGCTGQPVPTPVATSVPAVSTPLIPQPAATGRATDTPATAPTPPATPTRPATPEAGQVPEGWQVQTNQQLSIAIPPGWTTIKLSGQDAQTAFDAIKQNDPRLAQIIGGPDSLQGAALWAFAPQVGDFVDNLNIRRSPLGSRRVTDLQQVIDVLLPEYDKMGLKVTSTDAALRVHELPAARITYTMTMQTAGGSGQEIRGRQVIVASDTDLWILSFSTTPEREGSLASVFEQSAQSFEPK